MPFFTFLFTFCSHFFKLSTPVRVARRSQHPQIVPKGYFLDEEQAARRYDEAASKLGLPLNFPPLCEPHVASWTLLPPLGVTLTHLLAAAADRSTNTLSVTQRVRSKFVTMVFIKPARGSAADARLGPAPAGGQAAGGGFALPQLPSTAAAVAAQQQLQHQHQQPMDVGSRPASQTAFMEVG